MIANNTGPAGSLNTDSLAAALLLYRNTPDRDTQRSPAQILYSRQLKDSLPCHPDRLQIRPEWTLTADLREQALAKRHVSVHSQLLAKSKHLKPLQLGDDVQVQNQRGAHSNKWDLSGKIVEVQDFDSYLVRMDGSGRVTKRNRQFLKPIIPFTQPANDRLPLQQFPTTLQRENVANNAINTGSTADRREATTPCTQRLRDFQSSANNQPQEPDTLNTQIQMSDSQFNEGLMRSVRNVQRVHQNTDTIPKSQEIQLPKTDTPAIIGKRVRFPTKRLIEQ